MTSAQIAQAANVVKRALDSARSGNWDKEELIELERNDDLTALLVYLELLTSFNSQDLEVDLFR